MKKNVAIIVAHYDDAELSMGGAIKKFCDKGWNVLVIVTSSSDYRSYTGKMFRTKKQVANEGKNALNSLGVRDIKCLNYSTKKVPYNVQIIEKVNKLLDRYAIDWIFTHSLDDKHQDHQNTARAVISASRYYSNIFMFEPVYPSNLSISFQPKIYIDISNVIMDKIAALKLHVSQYKKYGKNWVDLVNSLSRLRGIEANCKYAEAFQPLKMVLKI